MTDVKLKPAVITIDERNEVIFKKQVIGVYKPEEVAVYLGIRPTTLVNALWTRKQVIALYRALPRIIKEVKKNGYILYGGLWFPNMEKETFSAIYTKAVEAVGIPEPGLKVPKAKKKKESENAKQADQEDREVALA